jgi:hypothetical protein
VNPTIPSCFWCGKLKNEIALFGKYGGQGQDLEAPMGVILDYEPCDECKENRKLGVTLMEVSERPVHEGFPEIQNGIYPTGRWCVIKHETAERMFSGFLNDKNALFIDCDIFDQIVGGNAQ